MADSVWKKRTACCVFLMAAALLFIFVFYPDPALLPQVKYESDQRTAVGKIRVGSVIRQEMKTVEGTRGIYFLISRPGSQTEGNLHIRISGMNTGKVYSDQDLAVESLPEEGYRAIFLSNPVHVSEDNALAVEISFDQLSDSGVLLWRAEQNLYDGDLRLDGEIQPGDLICVVLLDTAKTVFLKRILTVLILLMVMAGGWYLFFRLHGKEKALSAAEGSKLRLTRTEIIYLLLCGLIYLACAIIFRNTYKYGPDEAYRINVARFIRDSAKLPSGLEPELRIGGYGFSYGISFYPPYLISAGLMKIASLFSASEGAEIVAARLSSVLFMSGTAYYAVRLARRAESGPLRWAFIVPMTLTPQIVYLGSYLNLEAYTLLSVMMILDAWFCCVNSAWDERSCVRLGIGLALCLLGYEFGWAFVPASALLYVLWHLGRRPFPWKEFFRKGFFILILVILLCGWKFIRNAVLYQGDLTGLQIRDWMRREFGIPALQAEAMGVRYTEGISLWDLLWKSDWLQSTWESMISVLGGMDVIADRWVYRGYVWILPLAAVGLFVNLFREKRGPLVISSLFACAVTIFLSLYYSWTSDYQPQGRYTIYILPVLLFFAVCGLKKAFSLVSRTLSRNQENQQKWEMVFASAVFIFVAASLAQALLHAAGIVAYY